MKKACIIDGFLGVYVPQAFLQKVNSGELKIYQRTEEINKALDGLSNPNNPNYWDNWDYILANVVININDIPCAIDHKDDVFVFIPGYPAFASIVFMQGYDANEVFDILNEYGEIKAIEHLIQWDNGEYYDQSGQVPFPCTDETFFHCGYILNWSYKYNYIGLTKIINND